MKCFYFTIFLLRSKHKLLHRPVHGGDSLAHSHRRRLRCGVDGSPVRVILVVKHKAYRRTHNLDSPFDKRETQPSDTPHQKAYYELQVEDLLLEVLFAPILSEILVHRQYLHGRDHEPVNTNSYISSVLVE